MNSTTIKLSLITATLLSLSPLHAEGAENLILNGSFENFSIQKNHGRWKEVTFNNWEGKGEVWDHRIGQAATEGEYKIELDAGREFNSLAQTLTTEKGREYRLSLNAYARRANSSDFEIWIDDEMIQRITPSTTWSNYSVTFFGNGQAQQIQLKEIASQNDSLGTIIDNVSLVATENYDNHPPVILGDPKEAITRYQNYQFTPNATDPDDDNLTFSIQNKPTWATFEPTTGTLSGTPTQEGATEDINISVTDGTFVRSLPLFSIEVTPAKDIAQPYGVATQPPANGYYYYEAPEKAIDGDDSTYNHTQGTESENWWQLQLPHGTTVSKIMIQGRESNTWRLSDAAVYLSNTPYSGELPSDHQIATLKGSAEEQFIELDSPIQADYLLVKAKGDYNLHLATVEVYGATPETPAIENSLSQSILIPLNLEEGSVIHTIEAVDYQEDQLSYTISQAVPFAINDQGEIYLTGELQTGIYDFDVIISDGEHNISTPISLEITSDNAIQEALNSGVVTKVTKAELLQATRDEIATIQAGTPLLKAIYQENPINYATGGYSSQLINPYGDTQEQFPLLYGTKDHILALAGEKAQSRYAIFASNPISFFEKGEQLDFETPMKRTMAWLLTNEADHEITEEQHTIALSFMTSSSVESWLESNYPNWEIKSCNDATTLDSCYQGADLVVLSSAGDGDDAKALNESIDAIRLAHQPLLYLHPNWGENSISAVMEEQFEFDFPYGGNYWAADEASWQNSTEMYQAYFNNLGYATIDRMLSHFQNQDYNFDWSKCQDSSGNYTQDGDNCSEVPTLKEDFQDGADKVRSMLTQLDSHKNAIFDQESYRLQKLLVLLGDKMRQEVSYPMDKVTTDDNAFMTSFFSDHAIYNYRKINPAQADMGNFSRSDFSHITPTTREVHLMSKKYFRSTGAYALPGQTVKITRNDSSDLKVKVFVNTLRSAATHQYQKNGYKRPKYLQTPHFEIASGESIEITSTYGGTLQLEFDKNDLPVDITFENVGEHPYWASPEDNDRFAQQLDANEYDWAEISTAGFEVHSKLDKMIQSVQDDRWGGTAEGLANAVVKYTSNYPHVLAGFKGEGVDVVPEIHDWADEREITIESIDIMKHMNADQASCGYGCSGNPYDAYWAFDPIGHGDIHELGHSLQMKRFEGFPNHAATNTFSYYTKSKYFENTGKENDCGGLPFKSLFETIQAAANEEDRVAYLKTNLWDEAGLGEQYLLKIEAMMHAQKMGKVEDGWDVLARVHILEREMRRAKADWDNRKDAVGFSTYSLDEINAIGDNDWLIVAYSYAAGVDYRDYFDMMGIPFSDKAREQIATFGFDPAPKALFVSTDTGYCSEDEYGRLFDRPTLPIDGQTSYSY